MFVKKLGLGSCLQILGPMWAWPRGIAFRLRMYNIPNSPQPLEISSLSYCRHSFFSGILLDIAKVYCSFSWLPVTELLVCGAVRSGLLPKIGTI